MAPAVVSTDCCRAVCVFHQSKVPRTAHETRQTKADLPSSLTSITEQASLHNSVCQI